MAIQTAACRGDDLLVRAGIHTAHLEPQKVCIVGYNHGLDLVPGLDCVSRCRCLNKTRHDRAMSKCGSKGQSQETGSSRAGNLELNPCTGPAAVSQGDAGNRGDGAAASASRLGRLVERGEFLPVHRYDTRPPYPAVLVGSQRKVPGCCQGQWSEEWECGGSKGQDSCLRERQPKQSHNSTDANVLYHILPL